MSEGAVVVSKSVPWDSPLYLSTSRRNPLLSQVNEPKWRGHHIETPFILKWNTDSNYVPYGQFETSPLSFVRTPVSDERMLPDGPAIRPRHSTQDFDHNTYYNNNAKAITQWIHESNGVRYVTIKCLVHHLLFYMLRINSEAHYWYMSTTVNTCRQLQPLSQHWYYRLWQLLSR